MGASPLSFLIGTLRGHFTILEDLHGFDSIIGKTSEVAAPSGEHLLAVDDFIPVRVDERVNVISPASASVTPALIVSTKASITSQFVVALIQ